MRPEEVRKMINFAYSNPYRKGMNISEYQKTLSNNIVITFIYRINDDISQLSITNKHIIEEDLINRICNLFNSPINSDKDIEHKNGFIVYRFWWKTEYLAENYSGNPNIDLKFTSRFDCNICDTRCDGKSKTSYIFQDDIKYSEEAENWVKEKLTLTLAIAVKKTEGKAHGLPDLEIYNKNRLIARIEVKAQSRAFMMIETILPKAKLKPYETVALNLSDLERYISIKKQDGYPIMIIWQLKRPCIGFGFWGHTIDDLQIIYNQFGNDRRYRRKSTQSDIVDGVHKGVTVNYHFSLKELLPIDILEKKLQKFINQT